MSIKLPYSAVHEWTDSAFIRALIQAALSIIIQQWMRLKRVGNTVWFQITYIFP